MRQCDLLGLARSSYYYQPQPESEESLALLRKLDELDLEHPFCGSRRLAALLGVNRKRVVRLMRIAGIEALYPKPRLSRPEPEPGDLPLSVAGLGHRPAESGLVERHPLCACTAGLPHLMAVMDWFSRYVLSWELSATLDTSFCLAALEAALAQAVPEIFNTDQGAQFTALEYTATLRQHQIGISRDGRGRWLDNVFIERLWRSVKYELIYPGDFADGQQLWTALDHYFRFYNHRRPHQALGYRTPAELYASSHKEPAMA